MKSYLYLILFLLSMQQTGYSQIVSSPVYLSDFDGKVPFTFHKYVPNKYYVGVEPYMSYFKNTPQTIFEFHPYSSEMTDVVNSGNDTVFFNTILQENNKTILSFARIIDATDTAASSHIYIFDNEFDRIIDSFRFDDSNFGVRVVILKNLSRDGDVFFCLNYTDKSGYSVKKEILKLDTNLKIHLIAKMTSPTYDELNLAPTFEAVKLKNGNIWELMNFDYNVYIRDSATWQPIDTIKRTGSTLSAATHVTDNYIFLAFRDMNFNFFNTNKWRNFYLFLEKYSKEDGRLLHKDTILDGLHNIAIETFAYRLSANDKCLYVAGAENMTSQIPTVVEERTPFVVCWDSTGKPSWIKELGLKGNYTPLGTFLDGNQLHVFYSEYDPARPLGKELKNYYITVYDTTCAEKVLSGASLTHLADKPEVFPNPATDYITVNWPGGNNAQYKLLSMDGKKMAEGDLLRKDPKIRVGMLKSGTYLLILQTSDDQSYYLKVVRK